MEAEEKDRGRGKVPSAGEEVKPVPPPPEVDSSEPSGGRSDVTQWLAAWREGDPEAQEKLWSLVYAQLRRLAHFVLEDRGPRRMVRTTELVHETYLKLLGSEKLALNDRRHFFAVTARAMRQILVDYARRALTEKHGGGQDPFPLEEVIGLPVRVDGDLLALDEAMKELKQFDRRKHEIVEFAYFGGLTYDEIGESLGVSPATVKRDLKVGKIWLLHQLRSEGRS